MRTISHLLPSLLSGLAIALTGSPLDVEDRKFFGTLIVIAIGGGTAVVGAAGALGLAWRIFGLAAG